MSGSGGAPSGDDDGSAVDDGPAESVDSDATLKEQALDLWRVEDETGLIVRDILVSVAVVALIGLILFGISGLWPPLVAVESGSMEPNMHRGDLIFLVENDRYVGDGAIEGIVPADEADDHEKFSRSGDVIIFQPNGLEHETPVIHRAHMWVEEGDNWVEQADAEYVGGATCEEVATCPARHDGFITKGDANPGYDQHEGGAQTDVVKPAWVSGKAMLRVPFLGYVRLTFDQIFGMVAVGAGLSVFAGLRRRVH